MPDVLSPLSGESEAPEDVQTSATETSAPEPDASMAGALSEDSATTSLPPSFGQKVATSANNIASSSPPQAAAKPGAWARSLLGGVMDALSGFVAGGGVGPEHAKEQQAILGRRDQQRQQAIENQQKQQQMTREEAIARATIAHENASTVHEQALTSMLGLEYRQKNIETGTASLQPYIKAGAPIIQEGLDSDELKNLVQQKKLNPTQQHAFATGQKEVLDSSGKPELDEMSNPVTRPTYTVVGDVPQVELDEESSKLISENTPYKLPPGSKMSGLVYGTLTSQAQAAQTATAAINEARKKQELDDLTIDEKMAAIKTMPGITEALAKTANPKTGTFDPLKALQYIQADPRMKQQYPDGGNQLISLLGGPKELETMRHNRADEALKEQEIQEKKLAEKNNFAGDPNASTPQAYLASLNPDERSLIDLLHSGRAPVQNMGYLLARKPEIVEAMERAYPGEFDASKIGAYQSTVKGFVDGKDAGELQAGAVALQHLRDLKNINDASPVKSRVPGTADYRAYHDLLETVGDELGKFYGNSTIPGIEGYKKELGATLNRNAAIDRQVKSMGERLDTYDDKWKAAAPSKAYEAQMPGHYAAAVRARAEVDPEYRERITPTATPTTNPESPQPPGPAAPGMKWQHSPSTGQFRQVPINVH